MRLAIILAGLTASTVFESTGGFKVPNIFSRGPGLPNRAFGSTDNVLIEKTSKFVLADFGLSDEEILDENILLRT